MKEKLTLLLTLVALIIFIYGIYLLSVDYKDIKDSTNIPEYVKENKNTVGHLCFWLGLVSIIISLYGLKKYKVYDSIKTKINKMKNKKSASNELSSNESASKKPFPLNKQKKQPKLFGDGFGEKKSNLNFGFRFY